VSERDAARCFLRAAAAGSADACVALARAADEIGDGDEAMAQWDSAAHLGDPEANYVYGRRLLERNAGARGDELAISSIDFAAAAGYTEAEFFIGYLFYDGASQYPTLVDRRLVKKDKKKADAYFKRAAAKWHPKAESFLARAA
jgi:TPR repeat protein